MRACSPARSIPSTSANPDSGSAEGRAHPPDLHQSGAHVPADRTSARLEGLSNNLDDGGRSPSAQLSEVHLGRIFHIEQPNRPSAIHGENLAMRILTAGSRALRVDLDAAAPDIAPDVNPDPDPDPAQLCRTLVGAPPVGAVEFVPAARTVLVVFDPKLTSPDRLISDIDAASKVARTAALRGGSCCRSS
jgi:hypothetical protein